MKLKLVAIIFASFLTGAAGAFMLHRDSGPSPTVRTTGKVLIGGPFSMVDQNGKAVTQKDYEGRHLLLFFGFTHCPDVCPASLQVASEALETLGPAVDKLNAVFVSVDPERDTPDALKTYISNFNENLQALTGSPEQVKAIAKAYRVYYAKAEDPDTTDGYTVDHSTFMYLMGPDGEFITHFPFGIQSDELAKRLKAALAIS